MAPSPNQYAQSGEGMYSSIAFEKSRKLLNKLIKVTKKRRLGRLKLDLLHQCNEKDLYSLKLLEKPSCSGAIAQPSGFGGWLSVHSGVCHLVDSKLFFNLWRNLQ